MNLKQLSTSERATLIGGRVLSAVSVFTQKGSDQINSDDISTLGKDLQRVIDLIEESSGVLQ